MNDTSHKSPSHEARTSLINYQLLSFDYRSTPPATVLWSASYRINFNQMLRREIKAKLLLLSALYVVYEVHQCKYQNEFSPSMSMARSLASYYEEYFSSTELHYDSNAEEATSAYYLHP